MDAKEQVRQASDIAAVIGSYLELRRQGRLLVARCPWHDDTRPSLQVNPERQSWKCWVCDIGGDVFSFVMQREGVDFRQALELLAERAGIQLSKASTHKAEPGSPNDKKTLYAVMAWAEQQFHRFLLEAMEAGNAREYLHERCISDESLRHFHIGYSPNDWTWLLNRASAARYSPAVLQAVGLAGQSQKSGRPYDFFRGRVLFPIRDTQNRPIAFGGRVLPQSDDPAKYKNSPETRLYSKHEQLYGLDVAGPAVQKDRHIIVMEGYTDVIMAHQHGIPNAVAVCGTAIGAEHVRPRSLLRRYADRITLVLDGDQAGQRRTNELLEMFVAEQVDLRVAKLPEGMDPCDFLQKHGADAFGQLIAQADDALGHTLNVALDGIDLERDVHAANQSLETILGRMAKAPRMSSESQTAQRLREGQILRRIARSFGEEEEVLRNRLSELRTAAQRRIEQRHIEQRGGEQRSVEHRRVDDRQTTNRPATQDVLNDPNAALQEIAEQEEGPQVMQQREPKQRDDLSIDEQELFQIFCLKPQLFELALESIGPEHLHSDPGGQLFAAYHAVIAGDEYPDCQRVLSELENPNLKSQLVTVDWEAHNSAAEAIHTPEERLHSVLRRFSQREEAALMHKIIQQQTGDEDPVEMFKQALLRKQNLHKK